jgi:hypothetical protein
MKYSKYFGAKQCGFIKSKSVLAPKGVIHILNENIRYDICPWKIFHLMFASKAAEYPSGATFRVSTL